MEDLEYRITYQDDEQDELYCDIYAKNLLDAINEFYETIGYRRIYSIKEI